MSKMKPDDPAYWMLFDGFETKPVTYNKSCYICNDPEYAQMGLPLCTICIICGGHVPADDCICDNGHEQPCDPLHEWMIRKEYNLEISEELQQLAFQILQENEGNVLNEIVQEFKNIGMYKKETK